MAVINLTINGKKISKEVSDNTLLSDFLRTEEEAHRSANEDCESNIQKLTDRNIENIEKILSDKEKEISQI